MSFFNKIARETKLKLQINECKYEVLDLYEEIGKKIYEKHRREENIDIKKDLEEECNRIDKIAKDIEEARMKILSLNQRKQCRKCNSEINDLDMFCSQCGDRQEELKKTVFEEALEKLEKADINPENEIEARIVKEDLEEKI